MISSINATVHVVTAQNNPSHFLPDTVFATVGDTVRWEWVAGVHDVGPINSSFIPGGAAMWSAPIDVGNLSYEYVVTVAGSYYYVCHPSTPHGEDAYMEVSGGTGLNQDESMEDLLNIYPNPSNGHFNIQIGGSMFTNRTELEIYDLTGKLVFKSLIIKSLSTIDLFELERGSYMLRFTNDKAIRTKKIIIR